MGDLDSMTFLLKHDLRNCFLIYIYVGEQIRFIPKAITNGRTRRHKYTIAQLHANGNK